MGIKTELICPACNYEVLTDAGPSGGFYTITNTFICLDCKSLIDLVIGKRDENGFNLKNAEAAGRGHKCPKCASNNCIVWDNEARLCPKCETRMRHKVSGTVIFWD